MNRDQFERDGYSIIDRFWSDSELKEFDDDIEEIVHLIVGSKYSLANVEKITPQ